MGKQITSIFFVAGTCVGMGMLILPMFLAKLGIATSLVVMFLVWLLTYYTALASVELNLKSEHGGLSMGLMNIAVEAEIAIKTHAEPMQEKDKKKLGQVLMIDEMFSYVLLSIFIYAISFFSKKLLEGGLGYSVPIFTLGICWLSLIAAILSLPTRIILQINNLAFLCFLAIFGVLSVGMIRAIDFEQIPWFAEVHVEDLPVVIIMVLVSFGYQVVFHVLRNHFGKDANMLRRAVLWGSIISMVIYMFWTSEILGVIFKDNPEFFKLMTEGKITMEALINGLAKASGLSGFQIFFWGMMVLALFTSILGLGMGLNETSSTLFDIGIPFKTVRCFSKTMKRVITSLIVILPSSLIVILIVTNGAKGDFYFTKILGLAGVTISLFAIAFPAYLLKYRFDCLSKKGYTEKIFLPELNRRLIFLCCIIGMLIAFFGFMFLLMYEKNDTRTASAQISYVSHINSEVC